LKSSITDKLIHWQSCLESAIKVQRKEEDRASEQAQTEATTNQFFLLNQSKSRNSPVKMGVLAREFGVNPESFGNDNPEVYNPGVKFCFAACHSLALPTGISGT
jgi:hypothetical protein